jgi:hypothetical protein
MTIFKCSIITEKTNMAKKIIITLSFFEKQAQGMHCDGSSKASPLTAFFDKGLPSECKSLPPRE